MVKNPPSNAGHLGLVSGGGTKIPTFFRATKPKHCKEKSSMQQLRPMLFNHSVESNSLPPMDCNTPGFPVLHHLLSLLKLMSIESVMPSNQLFLCHPHLFLACNLSQHQNLFQSVSSSHQGQLFASGGQSTGTSASASVLPVNIQD